MDFASKIRVIEDFPEPGVSFKDITTLLQDGPAFHAAVEAMARPFYNQGIDIVTGPEARGFVIGAPLAYLLGAGFVPIRKVGKLPTETVKVSYELEYGKNILEIHKDSIRPGQKVLVVDDLLATGGTTAAAVQLIRALGGTIVALTFMIELTYLKGRNHLAGQTIYSLVTY